MGKTTSRFEERDTTMQHATQKSLALKLFVELGPLLAFFLAYAKFGIFWATGAIMVATVLSLLASWILFKRIAPMPVVTAVLVCIFGGLTFWLDDPSFIKMKPTMVNLLFGGALAGGMVTGRPLIKSLLGEQLHLTDQGWRKLTVRWMTFFFTVAALNELVWRNFSEGTWVKFKVFGILPLTMIFAIAQIGLMKKHEQPSDPSIPPI